MQARPGNFVIVDHYQIAENSVGQIRGKTAVIFDDYNVEHRCEWDPDHPERPERYTCIMDRYVFVFLKCYVIRTG